MRRYKEEEIKRAIKEFEKGEISKDAYEKIAYDFLKQNQYLEEYLKKREITPSILRECLKRIGDASSFEGRVKAIHQYCERHEIVFTKFDTVRFLEESSQSNLSLAPKEESYCYRYFSYPTKKEAKKVVIQELSQKLRQAENAAQPFGILEYYSYYQTDLGKIKEFIARNEMDEDRLLVSCFLERLENSLSLFAIPERVIFDNPSGSRKILGLSLNDEALKDITGHLILCGYPILTGILESALEYQSKGQLGALSKEKIKRRFERNIQK